MRRQRTMPRVAVTCQHCGGDFEVLLSVLELGGGKYCSPTCYFATKMGYVMRPVDERFWAKVNQPRDATTGEPDADACWLWTAYVDRQTGYARFNVQRKVWSAHRWAYLRFVGSITRGYVLDHLCRVRHCVNWHHLEPVIHATNVRRGKAPNVLLNQAGQCRRGHEASDENVYRRQATGGIVHCRPCRNERRREAYQRAKVSGSSGPSG